MIKKKKKWWKDAKQEQRAQESDPAVFQPPAACRYSFGVFVRARVCERENSSNEKKKPTRKV